MTDLGQKINCFVLEYLEKFTAQVAASLPAFAGAVCDVQYVAGGLENDMSISPTENERIGSKQPDAAIRSAPSLI